MILFLISFTLVNSTKKSCEKDQFTPLNEKSTFALPELPYAHNSLTQ